MLNFRPDVLKLIIYFLTGVVLILTASLIVMSVTKTKPSQAACVDLFSLNSLCQQTPSVCPDCSSPSSPSTPLPSPSAPLPSSPAAPNNGCVGAFAAYSTPFGDTLPTGHSLLPCQALKSGKLLLAVQSNGKLGLFNTVTKTEIPIPSFIFGRQDGINQIRFVNDLDGNFKVIDSTERVIFSSLTNSIGSTFKVVEVTGSGGSFIYSNGLNVFTREFSI
jgi:hypothetical protein